VEHEPRGVSLCEEEDIALMLRARAGEVAAFSRLFARHRRRVESFLFRLGRDRGKAEDGAQEVFLKLWRTRHRYVPRARFTTFLYQIAQNHWVDELRKARTRPAEVAWDVAIADLVKSLFQKALQRGASDLHLEMAAPGEPRMRFRIGGVLHEGTPLSPESYGPLVAHLKMMAGMNVTERRVPQDGRIAMSLEGKEYDLRVSTVPFLCG
jgi:RNA polymerase sigma factor (sigma-70 family)